MSEEPIQPSEAEPNAPPAQPPAEVPPPPAPKKRPPSRAERFQNAAQAVLDACDEVDSELEPYVNNVNEAIIALNDAVEALKEQIDGLPDGTIGDALQQLQDVRSEYQDDYDNMSERRQEGEKGQLLSAICGIDLEPSMPEIDIDVPGEIDSLDFDPIRDAAQECLDAELP